MDRFVANLQAKLLIAFSNAAECMSFMDFNHSETLKIEEFAFGVKFFISNASLTDIIVLFNIIDTNKDGMIDLNDLMYLMPV